MILCKENVSSDEEDENLKANRSKETVQVNKKYLWPHGITPPMKNVRKRRFRKTLKNPFADTSEIEKEVRFCLTIFIYLDLFSYFRFCLLVSIIILNLLGQISSQK